MIQRIQSLYLLLAVVALGLLFLFDVLWRGAAAETQGWFTPVVLGLAALAALTALGGIFLYKNRAQQRTVIVAAQGLTVLHLVAMYGGLFLADALYVRTSAGLDVAMFAMLVLPLVAYILLLLARRSVSRDIELVKSMDRLR